MTNDALDAFAAAHAADATAVRNLIASLRDHAGTDRFYVFWSPTRGAAAANPHPTRRPRTLVAFPSPDAALAFAQRNGIATAPRPRLRQLSLLQLLQAVLSEPAIGSLLLADDSDDLPTSAERLPSGIRITRDDLMRRLHGPR